MAELIVPDEVVIGFFTAAMAGLSGAVITMWRAYSKKK